MLQQEEKGKGKLKPSAEAGLRSASQGVGGCFRGDAEARKVCRRADCNGWMDKKCTPQFVPRVHRTAARSIRIGMSFGEICRRSER